MTESATKPRKKKPAPGLYLRGGVYWTKVYVTGRPRRESTECRTWEAAKRVLDQRRGRVADGAPPPPRMDRIRYDEIAADLRRHYEATGSRDLVEAEPRLKRLDQFFGGRRAATIGSTLITEYITMRQAEPTHLIAEQQEDGTVVRRLTSNRTINLELALLKRMLRLAAQAEPPKLLRVPKIPMLKEARPREGFFEDHQYQAVRRRLPEDLQAAVAIAHAFGWRLRSEVFPLARYQLDLKVGTLRLDPGTTKNKDGRLVYLTPELKALLAAQVERVETLSRQIGRIVPWLFPHLGTGKRAGMPRKGMRRLWQSATIAAGVPGRIPHDFRRTAVRNLERAGVPRSVATRLTGHRTESVYRRYAIVSDADLREATMRLVGTKTGTIVPASLDNRSTTL